MSYPYTVMATMITDVILEMIYFYSWTKNLIYVLILCPSTPPNIHMLISYPPCDYWKEGL